MALRNKILILMAFFIVLPLPQLLGQKEVEYTVTGKLVDEKGSPVADGEVILFPILAQFSFELLTETRPTEKDGSFTISEKAIPGVRAYLYASSTIAGSQNTFVPLQPPFVEYNGVDKRFLGLPVDLRSKRLVDLGATRVKFWYRDANLKYRSNGKVLSKEDWEKLWFRLIDDQGRCVVASSFAPVLTDKVDLDSSEIRLSLPIGEWKVELQEYDYRTDFLTSKIIAETAYFKVRRSHGLLTINIRETSRPVSRSVCGSVDKK